MTYQSKTVGRALLSGAALALCTGLAACGGTASGGTTHSGGTLTIGQVASPDTLDAPNSQSAEAAQVLSLITDTLYQLNPADGGQTLVPGLATGYSLSNGNRTWTFHLRHGVRFSDGQPMTSTDVKFSLLNAKKGAAQGPVDGAIATVTTPDPYDVSITTTRPDAALLSTVSYYSNGVIPHNFAGETANAFWKRPIGTGPFAFANWDYGVSLTLTRNRHYWQSGLPHLSSVVFKPVAEDASRIAGLRAGTLDAIESPPLSEVPALKQDAGVQIMVVPGAQDDSLYINASSGPLSNLTVRRAISLAINRRQIAQGLLFGVGLPASAPLPLNEPLFGPRPAVTQTDTARAKQLLASTPYAHGFSMTLITAAGNALASSIGQVLQQELAPLHIRLTVAPTDQSAAIADLQKGSYQAMFVPDTSGQIDPDVEAVVTSQNEPAELKATLNFPQMSKLALQAEQEFDKITRERLYERYLQLYVQQYDPIPVIYEPQVVAVSNRVKNFRFVQGGYVLTAATVSGR